MNTSPPWVTIGPPRFGVPHLIGNGTGARSRTVQGNLPLHLAGGGVDRQQRAPGRLGAGQAQGGQERGHAEQAVGRALHLADRGVRQVRPSRFQRRSRNEAGDRRQAAHVQDHPTPPRLKGDAPPIRSTGHAWVLDRPGQARRGEDAVVAVALDQLPALAPVPGTEPQASSLLSVVGANGCGLVGNGWVGQLCSPGTSDRGTGRSSTGKIGSPVSRSRGRESPSWWPARRLGCPDRPCER